MNYQGNGENFHFLFYSTFEWSKLDEVRPESHLLLENTRDERERINLETCHSLNDHDGDDDDDRVQRSIREIVDILIFSIHFYPRLFCNGESSVGGGEAEIYSTPE